MNSLIGDSRVRGLKSGSLSSRLSEVLCTPGAKLLMLEEDIRDVILSHHGEDLHEGKLHLYISAGICDITTRTKGRNYQEITFDNKRMTQIIQNMNDNISQLNSMVKNEGALPIFCTIYPMSLKDYNASLLHDRKTLKLMHQGDYESMQRNLEYAIHKVNEHIVSVNSSNQMHTPFLNKCMQHSRGGGNFTVKFNLLKDGCHPNNLLKQKIISSLTTTIKKNRN